MLQFYAEITQILRNLRNRYALLRRLRTVTHRYADGNLLMTDLDWASTSVVGRTIVVVHFSAAGFAGVGMSESP